MHQRIACSSQRSAARFRQLCPTQPSSYIDEALASGEMEETTTAGGDQAPETGGPIPDATVDAASPEVAVTQERVPVRDEAGMDTDTSTTARTTASAKAIEVDADVSQVNAPPVEDSPPTVIKDQPSVGEVITKPTTPSTNAGILNEVAADESIGANAEIVEEGEGGGDSDEKTTVLDDSATAQTVEATDAVPEKAVHAETTSTTTEASETETGNESGITKETDEAPPSDDNKDGPTDGADPTTATAPSATETPIGQSKGAQILMSRFSSWKVSANERAASLLKTQTPVLEENAKLAQEYLSKISTRFPTVMRSAAASSTTSAKTTTTTAAAVNEITSATLSPSADSSDGNKVKDDIGKATSGVDESSDNANNTPGSTSLLDSAVLSGDEGGGEDGDMSEDESEDETRSGADTSSRADTDHTTSTGTLGGESSNAYSRERMRSVLSRASAARSVVAETMATGFRGRYTVDVSATPTKADDATERKPSPESQMQLIMKSRAAEHMQEILNQLEEYEYAMLLGRGMLGVNLKQCFLKNHGIFVDYLVDGGQAQQSGLIRSGDLLVRLGESDLRKGTIKDIPLQIAEAKRPSVLVMATGTNGPVERITYVDVAVAMMHRARKYYKQRGSLSNLPSAGSKDQIMDSEPATEGDILPSSDKEEKTDDPISSTTPKSVCNATIPVHDTIDAFLSPPGPNLELRKEFVDEAPLRCLDKFNVSDLREVVDMDSNFRAAVRNAFLVCALDSRRLPFLSKHFSSAEANLTEEPAEITGGGSGGNDSGSNMAPSAQLMLFLELASFLDLYDVTPTQRLRDSAKRIAHKFFLPTKIGTGLQPPVFDFHHIVPDSSLRHLEAVLSGKSEYIPRDLFLDFQRSVADTLSTSPFLSFLASPDCARMRAYLRNTAPYFNLPLKAMLDSIAAEKPTSPADNDGTVVGAKNCFAYTMLYLICRMEKEALGEYDFGLEQETNHRLVGAANDLSCVLFVKRTLLPLLQAAKEQSKELKEREKLGDKVCEGLLGAVELFWDSWIADTMGVSSRTADIETSYQKVRNVLAQISEQTHKADSGTPKNVEIVLQSTLANEVSTLAEELLFDYASTVHTKFRDHKFHEWMCNELSKVYLSSDHLWPESKSAFPLPPHGCLKRLLRKVELPESVSMHKPYKVAAKNTESEREHQNADWAVVFGSSVGPELASQMPVPGLDAQDVRRYTCLPVALNRDVDYDEFRPEEVLPATFESYAVVPLSKPKPFAQVVDDGRMTVDGWEVSLVTFTIPNAESSTSGDDTESALFGVSLCFQRLPIDSSELDSIESGRLPTDLHIQEQICTNASVWVSPISFDDNTPEQPNGTKGSVRKLAVSTEIPTLNSHLKKQSWVERVTEDEYRDQSNTLMIGIALVSRRNVIFSMRETLSRLLFDFSRGPGQSLEDSQASINCGALVDVLGAFSYQDHEGVALKTILEPYLRAATSSWVDRPIGDQAKAFEMYALTQLTDSLPPTPLALMFVTALLEQKIVLSSSRRSILHAACHGLANLLRPLKWCHLLVPLVPGALAGDLIQYPAPFILGVPSEDADNIDLLGSLPRDVTLVDLDVGRVILAPSFGQENEMVRGTSDSQATARALRSQVLYLAQNLGTVFGNSLRPRSWKCDRPSLQSVNDFSGTSIPNENGLEQLCSTAAAFVTELLDGSTSCCYWIEEATKSYGTTVEPNVLFDEDRFFEIKNHRATRAWEHLFPKREANTGSLALNLSDFDLVLESFLRCQSMSLWISSRPKTEMLYY